MGVETLAPKCCHHDPMVPGPWRFVDLLDVVQAEAAEANKAHDMTCRSVCISTYMCLCASFRFVLHWSVNKDTLIRCLILQKHPMYMSPKYGG